MFIGLIILLVGLYAWTQVRKHRHDRDMAERAQILEGQFEEVRTTKHD